MGEELGGAWLGAEPPQGAAHLARRVAGDLSLGETGVEALLIPSPPPCRREERAAWWSCVSSPERTCAVLKAHWRMGPRPRTTWLPVSTGAVGHVAPGVPCLPQSHLDAGAWTGWDGQTRGSPTLSASPGGGRAQRSRAQSWSLFASDGLAVLFLMRLRKRAVCVCVHVRVRACVQRERPSPAVFLPSSLLGVVS